MTNSCDFCKETHCPAFGEEFFPELNEKLFVDFRFDAEFNQIDCQFGTLDENNIHKHAEWSNFAIDINYCPKCGRKLESTSYTDDYEVVGDKRVYKQILDK